MPWGCSLSASGRESPWRYRRKSSETLPLAPQEARERAAEAERRREAQGRLRNHERKRRALEAQIALLRAELEEAGEAVELETSDETSREQRQQDDRAEMSRSRKADAGAGERDKVGSNPTNGA